jgi:LysM repeat protein
MDLCCSSAKAEARNLSIFIRFMASHLAEKMFLSYLNGIISAGTIGEIVAAVKVHSTHLKIVSWVQQKIQEHVDQTRAFPGEVQLRDLCSNAIDTFRMLSPGPAVAEAPSSVAGRAYFSGNLQAVIGGINDITLSDSRIISSDASKMAFKGSYTIRDFYDFDNDRSMFPLYHKYRSDLTKLYASNCVSFMTRFHLDMVDAPNKGGDAKRGPLDKPQIFTCFMYAIEINKCTRSLLWDAEIPFEITIKASNRVVPPNPPRKPEPPLPPVPKKFPIPKRKSPQPPASPPEAENKIYVVKPGDNLSKLARTFYGDERLWKKIYEANKAIIGGNPNLIHPGQRLVIPA